MEEEKIISKIAEDARKKANSLVEQAKKEAKEEIEEERKKLTKYYEKKKDEVSKEAALVSENEILKAQLEARQIILGQKRACIEKAKKILAEKLENMESSQYQAYIEKALDKVELKDAEIIVGQKDKKAIEEMAKQKGYRLADEKREFEAGFIIKKGKVEYNNVFEDMLVFEKEKIEKILADGLFS